jgi:hypothetical protein
MPDQDLIGGEVLLIVPRDQPQLATALTRRFGGVSGLRIFQDRRLEWPQGERRRQNRVVVQAERRVAPERRQGERRGSHDTTFVGALRTPSRE